MHLTGTHTFAVLEVSRTTFEEIAQKLRAAGYDHAFGHSEENRKLMDVGTHPHFDIVDMHGIGLKRHTPPPELLKKPKLKPKAKGPVRRRFDPKSSKAIKPRDTKGRIIPTINLKEFLKA